MYANITSLTSDFLVLIYTLEISIRRKYVKYPTVVNYITLLSTFKKIDEYYNYYHTKQK